MKLTPREIELIDGMIEVQQYHASRCDTVANRTMADKQKGWDLERVSLLEKIKDHANMRCETCKWDKHSGTYHLAYCIKNKSMWAANDFCSYWERRG